MRELTLVYTTTWNPLYFWAQKPKELNSDAIRNTITLTGFAECPQALTIEEYLAMMWPGTGFAVLDFVVDYVLDFWKRGYVAFQGPKGRHGMTFCIIESSYSPIKPRNLSVEVKGPAKSIVEVCEIFAWLGGALQDQVRSTHSRLHVCIPRLVGASMELGNLLCHTSYHRRPETIDSSSMDFSCWIRLFKNPLLVQGFPVARRQVSYHGLEISLGSAAQLMRTRHLQLFDSKLYLKSFSALLVAVATTPEAVMWHYLCNENGGYLPYSEADNGLQTMDEEDAISLFTNRLHLKRHFVGWCAESVYLTGKIVDCEGNRFFLHAK
jgi:hypothetical protein